MPELPDVTVYVEHLARRLADARLTGVQVHGLNLLRTVEPAPDAAIGRVVAGVSRIGKRIAVAFEGGPVLVLHLMIAGRLHWDAPGSPGKRGRTVQAVFAFSSGTLTLTEAGTRKRAALHVVSDPGGARALDPGGLEPLTADLAAFRAALARESHTLKRALTDPRLFSGIGNAYSDEILHRARLSPFQRTTALDEAGAAALLAATQAVLREWTDRLRAEAGDRFPEGVTAFREGMAVHGRHGQPCPDCGAPVQRIVYAEHEANYCARCQTGGRLLADRAWSRLLKEDWPRTLEELEELRGRSGAAAAEGPAGAPAADQPPALSPRRAMRRPSERRERR